MANSVPLPGRHHEFVSLDRKDLAVAVMTWATEPKPMFHVFSTRTILFLGLCKFLTVYIYNTFQQGLKPFCFLWETFRSFVAAGQGGLSLSNMRFPGRRPL